LFFDALTKFSNIIVTKSNIDRPEFRAVLIDRLRRTASPSENAAQKLLGIITDCIQTNEEIVLLPLDPNVLARTHETRLMAVSESLRRIANARGQYSHSCFVTANEILTQIEADAVVAKAVASGVRKFAREALFMTFELFLRMCERIITTECQFDTTKTT
jgi:hypothetical protein